MHPTGIKVVKSMSNSSSQPRKNKRRQLEPTSRMIKQLRKASGYTQEEIRSVLGFRAASAVSRLESGDFRPDTHRLDQFLNLLKPDPAQKAEILEFFGYKSEDLKDTQLNMRVVRHHAEQHPFLMPFQNLFYLFVYQKDYVNVIEQSRAYQKEMPEVPESLAVIQSELQLVFNDLIDSRRLMAQGGLENRSLDYEEAGRRARTALLVLDMIEKRELSATLQAPGPALLMQVKLHAQLCLHSSLFKQLNSLHRDSTKSELVDQQFNQLRHELLPEIQLTLEQLQTLHHNEELNEMYRMYLFMQREYLHLLMHYTDSQDQKALLAVSADLPVALTGGAEREIKAEAKTLKPLLKALYEGVYSNEHAVTPLWTDLSGSYARILQEHQRLPNWDGESPEVMRAILKTFLGYSHALARGGNFDLACLFLDTLYLRLNVKESHYHWHSNYAVVYGYRYIALSALSTPKKQHKEALQDLLADLAKHLHKAIEYLHNGALDLEKNITRDDILSYTYTQEPAFYLVWTHSLLYGVQPHAKTFKQLLKDRQEWIAK
jgi:transcriptional regulator with XRE-family HTH domain